MWLEYIVDSLFGIALFVNAMLLFAQVLRILREKSAKSLSLIMFIGFLLIQFVTMLHGFLHKDYILAYGNILSMVACGTIIALIFVYRDN
tara:strand:+ start:55868 stop:56137 length:270 start_codon:yes stop_codon:yes gene_type:complete